MNNYNNFFSFSRNLENQPNAVQASSIARAHNFSSLQDAFSSYDGSLLLLGEPGIGKSFLLKEFQENLKQQNSNCLVIFLQIWTWGNTQQAIIDWVAEQTSYTPELLKHKIQAQQVIFVFDGLDELPYNVSKLPEDPNSEKQDYRLEFLQELSKFNQQFAGVKLLVSCRTQDYKDISNSNNIKIILNGAVELKALQNQDIQDYINQAFENDHQISHTLWNLLRRNRGLRKMVSNPLLLTIFVETCKSTQDIDKVAAIGNIGELFNSFLDQTYERWEKRHWETHQANLPLSLDELKNLLGQVTVAMMGDLHPNDNEIYLNTFKLVIQRYYQDATQDKIDELITLSQQLNLIVYANKNPVTYSFRHLMRDNLLALN
ncbi:MAG: NACHT domain-containing protein, partial [Cyanobacteria bacterium J06639_18]